MKRNRIGKVRPKFDFLVVLNVGWDSGGGFKPVDGHIFFFTNCC